MIGILPILVCLLYVVVNPIHGTSIGCIWPATWPGVVIGKRYLLFAPTAVDGNQLNYKVKVGSNNNHYGGIHFDIKGFVPHPNFTPIPGAAVGRTGKDNKDNIALVIVTKDLPIGRDNVEQANLPGDPNFNTVGPAYVLTFGFTAGSNYTKVNIDIHSKPDCEANHGGINCTTNLWATADSCEIEVGSPVFSGNTLIGTIATSTWCRGSNKHIFINNLPHYEKWIRRAIADEETLFVV